MPLVFRVKYPPLIETIAGKNFFHEPPLPKFPGPHGPFPNWKPDENPIKMASSSLLLMRSFVLLPSNPLYLKKTLPLLTVIQLGLFWYTVCLSVCLPLSISLIFSLFISLYLSLCLSVLTTFWLCFILSLLARSFVCLALVSDSKLSNSSLQLVPENLSLEG